MNKRKSNYIYIEMRHKMLIVGVIIIHVCFMLIGASGIISGLKEKNIFYGLLINMIYQLTLIIMIGVANQSNVNGYFVDYPILAVIMSVIMGPFTEELIYRGILFRFFSKYGELCAVLVTGFLFGTMHMLSSFGNANILLFLCQWLDYFLSGILLGFIYKKYQNIWINVSIHGTWNLIGAGMILTKIMLTK